MHRLITEKQEQIKTLCERHRVKTLYLFGSATSNDFDPSRSDLDMLVEFLPGPRSGFDDVYFQLHRDLSALFGRDVDLVEFRAIRNPYFRRSVDAAKVILYAA